MCQKRHKFVPWMLKKIINKFHTLPPRVGGVKKVWKIPYFYFILFLRPSLRTFSCFIILTDMILTWCWHDIDWYHENKSLFQYKTYISKLISKQTNNLLHFCQKKIFIPHWLCTDLEMAGTEVWISGAANVLGLKLKSALIFILC